MPGKFDARKAVVVITVINLSQAALIAAVLLYITEMKGFAALTDLRIIVLLSVILVSIAINNIAIFKNRAALLKTDNQFQLLRETLARLEQLNFTLRAQRHDFLNHLQVVYSLIEMDEYREASQYIEKVYTDIQKVSKVMKTSNPAVNALLQAKFFACEKKGILAELEATTELKNLRMPSWELCRVLGNIIDNAIQALEETDGEKRIEVKITEDLKYYYFKISNNGPPISENMHDKLFEPGFTTKKTGDGMGLAISKEILENYGGRISTFSNAGITSFEICVPK